MEYNDQVTVAVATQPARKQGLYNVIAELLPQCDRMCICFNGYDEIPADLPKSHKIVAILANEKSGIKDLGCNNKMYWVGDFPGYYATVDDDIDYPPNYISELKQKVDMYGRKAICSYHGHVYNNPVNGRIQFRNRSVYSFGMTMQKDIFCHRLGMGVAMCCPQEIGLTKDIFLSKPKNFGDDEITAVWAQQKGVPMVRVENTRVRMLENIGLSRNGGLCVNNRSMMQRAQFLESYVGWKVNIPDVKASDAPFFRVIVPSCNVAGLIDRCVESIARQTFQDFKIVIADDMSTDGTRQRIQALRQKYPDKILYEFLTEKQHGGGARNAAMKYFKNAAYTLFADSDDYYLNKDSLKTIHDFIVERKFPDLVKLSYIQTQGSKTVAGIINGNVIADIVKINAPWTSCVKTSLCAQFVPGRIRFNDVVQSMRVYDSAKTLAVLQQPVYVYTIGDNKGSSQHAGLDMERKAATYYLIADLMNESYKNKDVEEQRKRLILDKLEYLKENDFFV